MTNIILKPFPARERSSARNRVGSHEGQHCFAGVIGPKAVPSETANKAEVEAPVFAGKEAEPPWSTG